jgi:hypothetical protein
MGAHLITGTPRHSLVVSTMTIGSLAEPFADEGWNSRRTIGQLFPKLLVFSKGRSFQHRRYCIGCFDRLMINLQIFERFDDHTRPDRILHADE